MERNRVSQAKGANAQKKAEITIKFGKGLIGESFTTKKGKEVVEVKIPNRDGDSKPWESFIISPKMIHDNKFRKGVWMKLPENGNTKVSRSVCEGKDENGKNIWRHESREVSNSELKSMLEAYKEKKRDSVLADLGSKERKNAAPFEKMGKENSFSL